MQTVCLEIRADMPGLPASHFNLETVTPDALYCPTIIARIKLNKDKRADQLLPHPMRPVWTWQLLVSSLHMIVGIVL